MRNLLWLIIIILFMGPPVRKKLQAQTIHTGRWIGVVYDNSGSMAKAKRDKVTAYAFKLFTSILMPEDTLAIITMSEVYANPSASPRIFTYSQKRSLLNYIDGLSYNSGTPLKTLEQMLTFLQSIQHSQKSFVILTDGIFEEDEAKRFNIQRFFAREMNLLASYLILNPEQDLIQQIESQGILPGLLQIANGSPDVGRFYIENHQQIPIKMGELFAFATGKNLKGQHRYVQIQDNQLIITSPFPIRSVRFIYQSLEGKLITIQNVNHPYRREIYHHSLPNNHLTAVAGILHFNPAVAPDSVIRITFNQPLQHQNLFVFLDTFLELQLSVHNKLLGQITPVNQVYAVGAGDSLWLEGVFMFKNQPYQFSLPLVKQLEFFAQIRNGQRLEFQSTDRLLFKTSKFTLPPSSTGYTLIDVYAIFPGHFYLRRKLVFNTAAIKTRLLINGMPVVDSLYTTIPRHRLSEIPPMLISVVTEDGDTVTQHFHIRLKATPSLNHEIEIINKNAQVHFDSYFFPWKDPKGNVILTIQAIPKTQLYTPQETEVIIQITPGSFWKHWFQFIVTILIIAFLIKLLICNMVFPRFSRRAKIEIFQRYSRLNRRVNTPSTYSPLHKWTAYFKCKPEKRTVWNIPFTATHNAKTISIDRNFARNKNNILINGLSLAYASNQGQKHIIVHKGDEIEISTGNKRGTVTVLKFNP